MVQWAWISEGRALKWCSNFNNNDKQALQQAINDWVAAFTSSFGSEIAEGSPCDLEFRYTWSYSCLAGTWGCYQRTELPDLVRGGKYLKGGVIEFNAAQSWNFDRYRAVAAHELGHVFNLWEQYDESTFGCYSGTNSIMDTNIPGLQWCDSVLGPTSWDATMANWVHGLRPADQPSAVGEVGRLRWWFGDVNEAENHVAVHIRKYDGSTYGRLVEGWQHIAGIAPGDSNYWTVVSDSWYLGQDNRPGYYRACFAPWNAVVNNYPYYNCTGWQSVR